MSGKTEYSIQPGFFEVPERYYPEKNIVGASSFEVLKWVLNLHPEITRFSISSFDPDDSSSVVDIQSASVRWLARSMIPKLRQISDLIFEGSRHFVEVSNTEAVVFNQVLAVNSQVKHRGEIYHIPMLDFIVPPSPEAAEKIINRLKPGAEGVLIDSGKSYHFLGFEILTPTDWTIFMNQALSRFPEVDLLDEEYICQSLERGFSALRLFGYPDTEKPVEPKVVAVI